MRPSLVKIAGEAAAVVAADTAAMVATRATSSRLVASGDSLYKRPPA
jgi:hypothetical protein